MTTEDTDWKQFIINHLRERNKKECGNFKELITQNNRLLDNVAKLKADNFKLSVENEKLRTAVATGGGGKDSTATQLAIAALEKKLLTQQEELTELHKRKGENAQLIVDLKVKADKQQDLIVEKDKLLNDQQSVNQSLKAEVQMLKCNLEELKKLNNTLFDEHRALQLAFNSLEDKLRGVQNENNLLVERLMKYKTKDAEKLNEENEAIRRKKSDKLKRDLEDAFRETNSHRNSISPSHLGDEEPENGAIDPAYLAVELDTMLIDNNALKSGYNSQVCPTHILAKFEAHENESLAVRWSPMEPIIATGGSDRKVKVWQLGKGNVKEPRAILGGSSAGINSVDFDSKGAYILGTSNDFGARIWTTSDHRLRHTLTGHSGKVMAAKYVHEPHKVVTGSYDRTLKIWDLHSIACIETKFAGSSCNDLVTTDSLGSTIISGHYDKKVRFWDIRTEKQADDISMPSKVTSLDLSKDCNYLICAVRDDTIRVLDLRKNQIFYTFTHENFRLSSDFSRVSLNMDGTKIACGSADGLIYIWNINGFFEMALEGHSSPVYAVSWSPNANSLASVGKSKRCIIYTDS